MKHLTHILYFTFIILACLLCYFWVDRPLAILMSHLNINLYAHTHFGLAEKLTYLVYFLVIFIMVGYAYERITKGRQSHFISCIGFTSAAVSIAYFIKSNLQYFFGRLSPHYSGNDTLIFVRNEHLYGFDLLQRGGGFPSGHMCVFTAMLMMVSYFYPRLKWLCILLLIGLAMLLILFNYHFLSDVIAGTALGLYIAYLMHRLQTLEKA